MTKLFSLVILIFTLMTHPILLLVIFLNMDSFDLEQNVFGPTHNHGHTLDLIFTLGVKVSILECLDIPISDHKCITFTCELQSATYVPPCVVCKRTLNEQSTPKFCAFFSHNAAEILKSPHLNEMVDRFNYLCSSTLELLLSKIEAK